jgi:hypothetical protein
LHILSTDLLRHWQYWQQQQQQHSSSMVAAAAAADKDPSLENIDAVAWQKGDRIKVTKESSKKDAEGVVVIPEWRGQIKVKLDGFEGIGTPSYLPSELVNLTRGEAAAVQASGAKEQQRIMSEKTSEAAGAATGSLSSKSKVNGSACSTTSSSSGESEPDSGNGSDGCMSSYEQLLALVVGEGIVHPMERQLVTKYRSKHGINNEAHRRILASLGWTECEYENGCRAEMLVSPTMVLTMQGQDVVLQTQDAYRSHDAP